jgi:hypothetical protein
VSERRVTVRIVGLEVAQGRLDEGRLTASLEREIARAALGDAPRLVEIDAAVKAAVADVVDRADAR